MTRAVTVEGRAVRLPVVVRDATAVAATFVVPAEPARRFLPDGLTLIQPRAGRALLVLSAVDYRQNDLGDYHELSVALVVREAARGAGPLARLRRRTGIYIHRLPVDQEFSRAAGVEVWGFPKTVEELAVHYAGSEMRLRWDSVDGPVMRLAVRAGGRLRLPATAQSAYSVIDGELHRTRFLMRASGLGIRPGGAQVELGTHPAADELRALGLPKRALYSVSMTRMQARFDAPWPVSPRWVRSRPEDAAGSPSA